MDTIDHYAEIIKTILAKDAEFVPSYGEIESHLILDDKGHSYQLMYIGWNGSRRVHGMIIHIRIRNGKIWIEHDGTEEGVATALLEAGVPKEDIVLAFYSPAKRPYTEFAVA